MYRTSLHSAPIRLIRTRRKVCSAGLPCPYRDSAPGRAELALTCDAHCVTQDDDS